MAIKLRTLTPEEKAAIAKQARCGGSGMRGAMIAHCSSVNSSRRAIGLA